MTLPASILERLPPEIVREARKSTGSFSPQRTISLGCPAVDQALPDGGLCRGEVIEIATRGGASGATSLCLCACAAAQRAPDGEIAAWCAFVDPTRSLYAPGVAALGVSLERLLVVQPPVAALGRVALRLVESCVFALVVVDTVGIPGSAIEVSLGAWERIVRRLSISAKEAGTSVLLVTDGRAARPLPLPVAMRLELGRASRQALSLAVAKEKRGRVSRPRSIAWARSGGIEAGAARSEAHG